MKGKLILMRHGQSRWNELNLFTGWVDIPLSAKGIDEALQAGRQLHAMQIDIIFTSTLVRAQTTAFLAMSAHPAGKVPVVLHPGEGKLAEWSQIYSQATQAQTIPVVCSWHLNERMYGELQGLNKAETVEKYGKEQVHIWRRSFDVPPPGGESLAMTAARTIPYFKEQILPQLNAGKNVLVCAHGNSLRSIVMDLDGLTKEQVLQLEIATGESSFYTFQNNQWKKE